MRWALSVLTASALCIAGCDLWSDADAPDSPASPREAPSTFADAVDTVQPAVFHIIHEPRLGQSGSGQSDGADASSSSDAARRATSRGSGIILSEDGEAITNAHVVRSDASGNHTSRLKARLADGRQFDFQIVGADPRTDIALLDIESERHLPAANLADSQQTRVGDWVITIGYPLGYSSTATAGIVSGIGRTELPLDARDVTYQNFIQTDASVHRGGSGGALVDADARIIGMTTATVDNAPGLSFAIPSRVISRLLPELRTFGEVTKTWIGLFVDPVPDRVRQELDLPPGRGVLIKRIFDDGPAVDADVAPGDILMSLDGTPVDSVEQIAHVAGRLGLGRRVELKVRRGLENHTTEIPTVPHPQVDAPENWRDRLSR